MSQLLYGALVLCGAFTIPATIYASRVHDDFTHSSTRSAISTSTLLGTLVLCASSATICMITWNAVVGAAPQSGEFSSWYVAEMLLVLTGTTDILCLLTTVGIAGNIWNQKPVSYKADTAMTIQTAIVKKRHLWWSLRRKLAGMWR